MGFRAGPAALRATSRARPYKLAARNLAARDRRVPRPLGAGSLAAPTGLPGRAFETGHPERTPLGRTKRGFKSREVAQRMGGFWQAETSSVLSCGHRSTIFARINQRGCRSPITAKLNFGNGPTFTALRVYRSRSRLGWLPHRPNAKRAPVWARVVMFNFRLSVKPRDLSTPSPAGFHIPQPKP